MRPFSGNGPRVVVRHRVPFYDLDPMQVVWHGNYLNYFELARQALFDRAGIDFYDMHVHTGVAFPVIRSSVKHVRALRFRDEFDCQAVLVAADTKLVVDFEIHLVAGGQLCARGQTEQAAVRMPGMELLLRIPDNIRQALQAISPSGGAGC